METLLILLGVLGFAATLISVHIFPSGSEIYGDGASDELMGAAFTDRAQGDRRSGLAAVFPILINGMVVNEDRRSLRDRRESVA